MISHRILKFANVFSVESLRYFRFEPKLHDYALLPTQHYIYTKNIMHMHNVHCTKAFILIHLEGLLGWKGVRRIHIIDGEEEESDIS